MAKSWNLKKCIVTVGGVPVSGLADGDAMKVAMNEDAYKLKVGADGEAVRSKTNNRSGKITLTLKYSSNLNTVLEAYRLTDDLTDLGQFPVQVQDLNSGTTVFAPQAWVLKPPDLTFGMEESTREWVLESGEIITANVGILLPL